MSDSSASSPSIALARLGYPRLSSGTWRVRQRWKWRSLWRSVSRCTAMAWRNIGVGYSARFTPGGELVLRQLDHVLAVDLELVARRVQAGHLQDLLVQGLLDIRGLRRQRDDRVLQVDRHRQRRVELGPRDRLTGLDVVNLGVLLPGDPAGGAVDLDRRDQRTGRSTP